MSKTKLQKADIYKFVGLIAFFILMGVVVCLGWPWLSAVFKEGGLNLVLERINDAGFAGVFVLLGLQFLQIVVAIIPGEITQVAAGLIFGPWLGALIILVGCIISSAFIFMLVRKLGAPFVQSIVPTKQLSKFREFEKKGKLNIIVFILFLIPGLPKDTFSYLVPLTDMRMKDFIVLSNLGRIPGIVVSTYAASGFSQGRIAQSIVIFVLAAIIALIGLIFRDKVMDGLTHIEKKFIKKGKNGAEPKSSNASSSDKGDSEAKSFSAENSAPENSDVKSAAAGSFPRGGYDPGSTAAESLETKNFEETCSEPTHPSFEGSGAKEKDKNDK